MRQERTFAKKTAMKRTAFVALTIILTTLMLITNVISSSIQLQGSQFATSLLKNPSFEESINNNPNENAAVTFETVISKGWMNLQRKFADVIVQPTEGMHYAKVKNEPTIQCIGNAKAYLGTALRLEMMVYREAGQIDELQIGIVYITSNLDKEPEFIAGPFDITSQLQTSHWQQISKSMVLEKRPSSPTPAEDEDEVNNNDSAICMIFKGVGNIYVDNIVMTSDDMIPLSSFADPSFEDVEFDLKHPDPSKYITNKWSNGDVIVPSVWYNTILRSGLTNKSINAAERYTFSECAAKPFQCVAAKHVMNRDLRVRASIARSDATFSLKGMNVGDEKMKTLYSIELPHGDWGEWKQSDFKFRSAERFDYYCFEFDCTVSYVDNVVVLVSPDTTL